MYHCTNIVYRICIGVYFCRTLCKTCPNWIAKPYIICNQLANSHYGFIVQSDDTLNQFIRTVITVINSNQSTLNIT